MNDWIVHTLWTAIGAAALYGGQYIARLRSREMERAAETTRNNALLAEGARREQARLDKVARKLGTCKYHSGLHECSTGGCKDWTFEGLLAIDPVDFNFHPFRLEYKS